MLMRWDPFRQMEVLQRDLNRVLEARAGKQSGLGETMFPRLDVSETNDDLKVRLLVPGLSREDVKISLHQDVLSISGVKQAPEVPEGARVVRNERSSGQFQRTVRLPKPVDEDRVTAHMEDGVLTLFLPVQEEAKPREIEVSVN